jgi:hypothetical protein
MVINFWATLVSIVMNYEYHSLKEFEGSVLKRTFGPKTEVREDGENCILRRMRWVGHVAIMGEQRKVYKVLVGKLEGKMPLERQKRRWEDGIRMDRKEMGWEGGVEWISWLLAPY